MCDIFHPFRFTILFGRINHEISLFLIAGAAADAELRCRHKDYFVYGKKKYHRPLNIVVCEFDDIFILKNRVVFRLFSLILLGAGLMCGI